MPTFLERIRARKFTSAASNAVDIGVSGDTQARLSIDAGGKLVWGGGLATGDVTLYRDSANILKTDDTFTAPALFVNGIEIDTTGATANNILKYNGTKFTAASISAGAAVTSSATAPNSPNTGDLWLDSVNVDLYIYYDNHWVQLTGEEPLVEDLNDLADVDTPSPQTNDFLKYNGTYWIAASVPAINALDDIGDVNVSGASSGQFLKWNGTNWVADSVVGGATASSSTPSSPTTGQLWFDTDDARTYVYYDSTWVEVGASGMAAVVSDSAPSSPISGQIWYKSDTGGTYVYYNSTWVEVGAAPAAILPTIVDAKGDLIVGTANDTVARQAVGTNDHVLIADSVQTNGIKWGQIQTAGIADSAVTTAKLATSAKPGLVLVSAGSFTTVTSFSLPNDTFTSTYKNYKMIVSITAVSSDISTMTMRLRASGSDTTGNVYESMLFGIGANGGGYSTAGQSQTSFQLGESDTTYVAWGCSFDILNPKETVNTRILGNMTFTTTGAMPIGRTGGFIINNTTSYDSLSIISNVSSSITGTYRVYGYSE